MKLEDLEWEEKISSYEFTLFKKKPETLYKWMLTNKKYSITIEGDFKQLKKTQKEFKKFKEDNNIKYLKYLDI